MSKDIKVGDLVYVARPSECCGSIEHLGDVMRVGLIDNSDGYCDRCGADAITATAWSADAAGEEYGYSLNVLEKFLDFPESEPRDTERELEAQS